MALRHGTWVSQETPGIGVTSPLDARLAVAGTLVRDTSGKARSGVFYDGTVNLVNGTAGMTYQVGRCVIVQARSAADGAVIFANDGTVNVTTSAAPAANSRIDVIYAWHRDFVTDGNNSDPVLVVAQGAAAPIPAAPALPTGAVELARAVVSAGAVATNSGGVVITQTAQFTAAAGGVVMFRTKGALDLWTTAAPGQPAVVLADGLYVFGAGGWSTQRAPSVGTFSIVASYSGIAEVVRCGNVRQVSIRGLTKSSGAWPEQLVIATLDPEDRPLVEAGGSMWMSDLSSGGVRVNPNGSVAIYPGAGKGNSVTANISATYLVP